MLRYYILNKPYGILAQFTEENENPGILSLGHSIPNDVYPVGRLDFDSEGFLLLTNDKRLNSYLLDPDNGHYRTYLVQLENEITQNAIKELSKGVTISIKGKKLQTLPCKVEAIEEPNFPERIPPIRYRKNIPTCWIKLSIKEGKNRQVKRMTAKVGFPTLRLIRIGIADLKLDGLQPGELIELEKEFVYKSIGLRN